MSSHIIKLNSPDINIAVFKDVMSFMSSATLAGNVLRLGEGGDFHHKC